MKDYIIRNFYKTKMMAEAYEAHLLQYFSCFHKFRIQEQKTIMMRHISHSYCLIHRKTVRYISDNTLNCELD